MFSLGANLSPIYGFSSILLGGAFPNFFKDKTTFCSLKKLSCVLLFLFYEYHDSIKFTLLSILFLTQNINL